MVDNAQTDWNAIRKFMWLGLWLFYYKQWAGHLLLMSIDR